MNFTNILLRRVAQVVGIRKGLCHVVAVRVDDPESHGEERQREHHSYSPFSVSYMSIF